MQILTQVLCYNSTTITMTQENACNYITTCYKDHYSIYIAYQRGNGTGLIHITTINSLPYLSLFAVKLFNIT